MTSASQKNPPASSSYIFQKLSHGKKMCQKLREQTDQLRSKVIPVKPIRNHRSNHVQTYDTTSLMKDCLFSLQVQEFSKSIAQDSPCRVRDNRLVIRHSVLNIFPRDSDGGKHKRLHSTGPCRSGGRALLEPEDSNPVSIAP